MPAQPLAPIDVIGWAHNRLFWRAHHARKLCMYRHTCVCRAVGLGGSGAVYFGANLEFPGNPLSQSVSNLPLQSRLLRMLLVAPLQPL